VARAGSAAIAVRTDVSRLEQVQALADRAFAEMGAVHVLCNNAGVALWGGLESATHRDWEWAIGVNLWGVIHGVETFVPRMIAQHVPGHIVNTASMAGLIASQGLGVYNTTKYAVVGMSETMRADLAPHNIGVSVLCPGVVTTNIFDSGRNRPEDLKGETDTASLVLTTDMSDAERAERMQQIMASALDPAVVGDMVLAAIQTDDPYIFTHPDLKPMVDARSAAINASFARWAQYRKDHGV
jgi:NAD(P)-dependent dehydrogenase (short-subunit alcohol dehydrogenase family)